MNPLVFLRRLFERQQQMDERQQRMHEALGRIERRQLLQSAPDGMHANEFQVYSQWGEDGIIQWLLGQIEVPRNVFVEFGVQDYEESSTRFLLVNNHWSGLILDGSAASIERVRRSPIYWRHNLKALQAFVTRENINELLTGQGLGGDIGLLSVDIDGNDYWVWQAITCVSPAIVVVEYNARFGIDRCVTIPYNPSFERTRAHHSGIYYGASLPALYALGRTRGYSLVGCNSAGNNAFFVRDDLRPPSLPALTVSQGFVASAFRETRDEQGMLMFLSADEERELLADLPLIEVEG
jgi:hypothetical protein